MTEPSEIRFTVFGDPVAKQRARVCRLPNGMTRSYTPSETVHAEATVREVVQQLFRDGLARRLDGPIEAELVFFRRLPKSASRRKREAMLAGLERPTTKPDWDNLGKLVTDALNEILYLDDAALTDVVVRKRYAEQPRTEIVLREVAPRDFAQEPRSQAGEYLGCGSGEIAEGGGRSVGTSGIGRGGRGPLT
jgi:Holliday junction resolvase RusA-like endonuclease